MDEAGATFATVLADAIAARGVTLSYLSRELERLGTPVSVTTISYWRTGRRQPDRVGSARVLARLEKLLELDFGALSDLARSRPPQPGDADGATLAVLRRLGADADPGLTDDSVQHLLDVDADGSLRTLRVRCLHRATRDGVDRRVLTLTKRHPDGASRAYAAVAGGRIGRTAEDLAHGVYAAEFLFDRPLRRGETVVIEYAVDLGVSSERFFEVAVERPLRHVMVWVRFDAAAVPPHVEIYRDARSGGRLVRRVDMAGTTSVHHAVSGRASLRVGVRWRWQDES